MADRHTNERNNQTPFGAFEELAKKLLRVPKTELDEQVSKEKAEKKTNGKRDSSKNGCG